MKYTEYTDEQIQEIKRQRDRRKRQQITVIVFILGVLFALERGGAIYLVLGIACLLMGVLLLVDHIRREREEKAKKQDAADADKE